MPVKARSVPPRRVTSNWRGSRRWRHSSSVGGRSDTPKTLTKTLRKGGGVGLGGQAGGALERLEREHHLGAVATALQGHQQRAGLAGLGDHEPEDPAAPAGVAG